MIPRPTLKIFAGRVAAVALAAILGAVEKRGVPHDLQDLYAVGGVALLTVISQAPNIFAAAGIIRPLSSGQASLYQRLTGKLAALAAAPKDKRRQKLQEDIQAALSDPQTLQTVLASPEAQSLIRSQMVARADMWQPGQPVPAGAEAPTASAPGLDLDANRFAAPSIPQKAEPAASDSTQVERTISGTAMPATTEAPAATSTQDAIALTGGNQ